MDMRIHVQKSNNNIYRCYSNVTLELARLIRFYYSGRQWRTRVQTVSSEIHIPNLMTGNQLYIRMRLHNTVHNIIEQ